MNKTDTIPFLDLVAPHEELKEELRAVFDRALSTGAFIGGPMVEDFEKDFAAFCDAPYCVGVGSGTDALRFALIAAGVKPRDAVVTVPNTFIATVEAISQAGASPVFVDINELTYNMDSAKLREYLEFGCTRDESGRPIDRNTGRRVTAVVPVHLYGQMCDMDQIVELAELYNLIIVEDACQAHGAVYYSSKEKRSRKAGSLGRAAAFSFYPGKNLGACGEAGAVVTSNTEIAESIRMLRDHGQARKYYHNVEGYNGRLDAIQAGILRVKLRHLASWNEARRKNAKRYRELFNQGNEDVILPYEPSWSSATYHLYVVRVHDRDNVQKSLSSVNVGTGIHYPVPLHLQQAYRELGYAKGDFPVSEGVSAHILSLPMYPSLTEAQQQRVVDEMQSCTSLVQASGQRSFTASTVG